MDFEDSQDDVKLSLEGKSLHLKYIHLTCNTYTSIIVVKLGLTCTWILLAELYGGIHYITCTCTCKYALNYTSPSSEAEACHVHKPLGSKHFV